MGTEDRLNLISKLAQLVDFGEQGKLRFMIVYFYRTAEEQAELFSQGRTKPGKIVTNCDGYIKRSKHQMWRAFDIVIINDDNTLNWTSPYYDHLGEYWKEMGGIWGGDFPTLKDKGHFEV